METASNTEAFHVSISPYPASFNHTIIKRWLYDQFVLILAKRISKISEKNGSFLVPEIERMSSAVKDLGRLAQMVAEDRLHPQIGLEASWTEVVEVIQYLLGRRIAGKAILYVS